MVRRPRSPAAPLAKTTRSFPALLSLAMLASAALATIQVVPAAATPTSSQAAAASTASQAAATPAAGPAAARLVINAGDVGGFIPGRPAPVRVQIDSDVLVAGQLVVSTGTMQLSRAVELPGGSSQQFEMVVPTPAGQPQVNLVVSLMAGRAKVAGGTATLNALPDTEVIGILPQLLVSQPVPGPAPLSVDTGTARFVAVTEQDLALAPASLGPLSAVALGPDDLGRLSPGVRQGLLAWATGGGRLLIDAGPKDTVTGLPASWEPQAGSRAPAGQGEVVLTNGAMAAGRWAGLVDPASHDTHGRIPGSFNGVPLGISLASAAGLSRPKLRWLMAFILVYILVVGPLCFLVLRRQRRAELLWVVIPLVALLFAGSSYRVGSSERSGLRIVHGTVVNSTATGGGTALSYIGVSSPGEATSVLQAPSGWALQRYDDPSLSGPGLQSSPLAAALVDRGIEGRLRLAAGQFAIVQGSGPAHFPGQLLVTARSDTNGHAEGTVTNGTPFALHDVSVLIGGAGADVGALAPGAHAAWQINGGQPSAMGVTVEEQLWGPSATGQQIFNGPLLFKGPMTTNPGANGAPIPGAVDPASPANLPVWSSGPDGLAPGTRGTGLAVAVGWTDQYHPPLTVAGHGPPTKGTTAIVGTSPVDAGLTVGDLAIVRRVIRGGLAQVGPGMFVNPGNTDPTVVAWALPPAAAGHDLLLTIPAGSGEVDVWSARGGWQALSAGANGIGGGMIVPTVPFLPAPAPLVTAAPAVAPTTAVTPPTTAATGAPTTTILAPAPKSLPPGAIPIPFPSGPGQIGPGPIGPATSVAVPSADAVNGVVYVRLGAITRPIELNSLSLSLAPQP